MALTLVDAGKLTQDMLQKGVIETMATTSGVLARLPFVEVVGSGYSYNLVNELPSVGYREVNDGYTESTVASEKMVEHLTILGGDADVDIFLQRTHSNINDIRAMETQLKATAVARQFEMDFFKGTGTGNALKGLDERLAEAKVGVAIKEALTLEALNQLLDSVVDGADVLFMSKTERRKLLSLLQASNHYIESGTDAFGRPVTMYGGIEIVAVDDSLIPAGKIYAVKFGVDQYVHGLSNGGVQVKDLGELQVKPVYRTRIEFYCGLATKHPKCFAVLDTTTNARKK